MRARDVQLLFADASTGAHSPAMVGQGRIGELIAAKPVDRRALLEEAAGISGLHNRRHEAELRLRAAEQNLARLDDVIAEIEQQLDALKRQARQATRYRNLSGEIRKAEATVLHLRWLAATRGARPRPTAQPKAAADDAERAGRRSRRRRRASRRKRRRRCPTFAMRRRAPARRCSGSSSPARRSTPRKRASRRGSPNSTGRLAQLGDDIEREQRMVADNGAILARLDEEEKGLEAANAAMAERQASAAAAPADGRGGARRERERADRV